MSFGLVVVMALFVGQASASAPPAGRLSGRVTAEGTGAPIVAARVSLIPASAREAMYGPPPEALTDESGRFVFTGVGAGEYQLDVQKSGFAPLVPIFGPPPRIQMPAGRGLDGVDFQLQRGGVIAGRVLDASGEPMSDLQIMALRRYEPRSAPGRPLPAGLPGFMPAPMRGPQNTNDLGEFRLAGLAPGEYIIAASRPMTSPFGRSGATAATHATTLATTYYPGATSQSAAQPIAVRAGDTVANIEFTMQSVPAFRIAGRVVDEGNQPIAGAMVMVVSDFRTGAFMGPAGGTTTDAEGRFSIADVMAGTYRLHASIPMRFDGAGTGATTWTSSTSGGLSGGVTAGVSGPVVGGLAVASGGPGMGGEASAEVVVTDANVTGVKLTIQRPRD